MSTVLTHQATPILQKAEIFAQEKIAPIANQYALSAKMPINLIRSLADEGFLGSIISTQQGGLGLDYERYGDLNRILGRACSSVRSLLTVHDMVSYAVQTFGDPAQKRTWLPAFAKGTTIAAFALTEPELGSSIDKIQASVMEENSLFYLSGSKVWISFGQIADLFLVFAKLHGNLPIAVLVPAKSNNVHIKAIENPLGFSGSLLAEVSFNKVKIDPSQILGVPGMGLSFIATQCLTLGRYSVACGALGIIEACLDLTRKKVTRLRPDGSKLIDRQLIAKKVTDMISQHKMASLLCRNTGEKLNSNFINALEDVMIAKYVTAKFASESANEALQIHGAEGFHSDSPLRRFLHDAKVCELIEGSNEIMQDVIARSFIGTYRYEQK